MTYDDDEPEDFCEECTGIDKHLNGCPWLDGLGL